MKTISKPLRRAFAALASIATLLAVGCEDDSNDQNALPPAAPTTAETTGPDWQQFGDSIVLTTTAPADDSPLAKAIAQARSTLEEARTRWVHAEADDQQRWAVKWAAPTETGKVEYVWVRPEHWSKFRIEGVLLTEPVHTLVNGAARGDLVSFPAEQLVDWVHIIRTGETKTREGGYTIDALAGDANEPSRGSNDP